MTDLIKKSKLRKMTKGLKTFPSIAAKNILKAQTHNAREARSYMQILVPKDEGITASETTATAYIQRSNGTIGFAMRTDRDNRASNDSSNELERIKAILFANGTDFFYGVWNLNKKRWKGRMRRAMTKSSRELTGKIK